MMLTAEKARQMLSYDPTTGVLTWRVLRPGTAVVGSEAGVVKKDGYRHVSVCNRTYRAHRIIWLMMTGQWPSSEIDHKNLDRADNRWENLREATRAQNQCNIAAPATNTSGVKGVTWHRRCGKWQASITKDGKLIYLGLFDDIDKAAEAYATAARGLFGEFRRVA